MSGEIINADRSLAQVTQGIRVLTAQTVANMCQIGKLLTEAKSMVGHGGWGEYLEKEVAYSQSTANNFMRLYEEYGEFGPNSQTIANLGPTKAGLLLALPAEQREQFAEEHKDDSVRQLKKEIAKLTKRVEAAEASDQAARVMLATATEEAGAMRQRLESIDADYRGQLDTVDKENDALRAEVAQLKAAADAPAKISAEDAERLRAEGRRQVEKELREEFQLSAAEDQEDIDELTAKAEKQAAQILDLERQLEEAKAAPTEVIQGLAKENDAKLAERDARIAELERQLEAAKSAASGSDARFERAEIQRHVNTVGEGFNSLLGYLLKAEGRGDEGTAKAIRAVVAQQIKVVRGKFGVVA